MSEGQLKFSQRLELNSLNNKGTTCMLYLLGFSNNKDTLHLDSLNNTDTTYRITLVMRPEYSLNNKDNKI